MKNTTFAELHLPIFKQGDDLSWHMEKTTTASEAMRGYAENLREAAEILNKVATAIEGKNVDVTADTHFIGITGPTTLIESLIKDELLDKYEFEDEDEELDEELDEDKTK